MAEADFIAALLLSIETPRLEDGWQRIGEQVFLMIELACFLIFLNAGSRRQLAYAQ